MTMLEARASKKHPDRVLCGRSVCRGELGDVVQVTTRDGSTKPVFHVPGVYSKHRDGQGVSYRLRLSVRRVELRLEQRRSVGREGDEGRLRTRAEAWDKPRDMLSPEDLPVTVECPRCGWQSEVTADLLDKPHTAR